MAELETKPTYVRIPVDILERIERYRAGVQASTAPGVQYSTARAITDLIVAGIEASAKRGSR
jgi:hypothetical protein